jgi:hypothetical protein
LFLQEPEELACGRLRHLDEAFVADLVINGWSWRGHGGSYGWRPLEQHRRVLVRLEVLGCDPFHVG